MTSAVPPPPERVSTTPAPTPAAKQGSGGAGWMRRFRLSTVLILAFCLVIAGLLSRNRDEQGLSVRKGKVSDRVQITATQTLQVLDVQVGGYLSGLSVAQTPGIFVVATVQLRTDAQRQVVGVRCVLQTRDHGRVGSFDDDTFSLPEPGFNSTMPMAFELAPEDVGGSILICSEVSVITVRPTEVRIDLGLSGEALEQVLDTGQGRTVTVDSPVIQVNS